MRRALLGISIVAMLALALPVQASANWTHKGKGELKENASLTLTGELTLSTSAGNVTCPTTIGATLTASSSAGEVNSFTVSEPSKCDLTGSLAAICGTNGLTKVEKTGTWALAADETDITLSSIDIHYTFSGCLISTFRLKGSATAALDKTNAIGKTTLSGTQTLYNALGEESGTGELKGTLSSSPAGTYGVKTAPLVETKWTMGNEHLSEDGKLILSGIFSFSGSGGSVSCPASIKLVLESSTIEEEESEGQIESFTVSKPSECDVGGALGSLCGTHSVASVESTGTTSLATNEEDISISGLVLDYKFEKCAVSSLRVEGSPTLTVDDASTIGSVTFSGGGLEIYNAGGETTGTGTAGGSASASPSGTFQVAPTPPPPSGPSLQGGEWYVSEETIPLGKENSTEVEMTGEAAYTGSEGGTRSGPCITHAVMKIWNVEVEEEVHATAEVTSFTITAPCSLFHFIEEEPVSICTIEAAEAKELPWHVSVTGTNVAIKGAKISLSYSGCPPPFNSATITSSGTVTGVMQNTEEEMEEETILGICINFASSGDMTNAFGAVTIDGSLCS